MYSENKLSWWLYGIGLILVFGSHIYMLVYGLAPELMTPHAILNLVAGVLLMTGWLKR
ncbi:MAG: hypothetical protein WC797_01915 [Candidatus Paceibacterota bacterium]|jgi:hypothetical protein